MDVDLLDSIFAATRELHSLNLEKARKALTSEGASAATLTTLVLTIPQKDQRELLGRLAAAWRSAGATVTACMVEGAFEAALHAARSATRAEVCWSGPTSSLQGFRSTVEAYRELISGAERSAFVLSFALSEVEELRVSLESAVHRGVAVRMILEDFHVFKQESWSHQFAALGSNVLAAASIFVWPTAKRRQVDGRVFGAMHVKCLIVDDTAMLLTSANWSGAAMQDNMELGVVIRDRELIGTVVAHFYHLISIGVLAKHVPTAST